MKVHEFLHKYANVPLPKRDVSMRIVGFGVISLNDIFQEIKTLEDAMRPLRIREEELLEGAEGLFDLIKMDNYDK